MATNTIGASIAGNSSVSSRASEARPNTTSAIIVTTVMIGRLMAKSEMNMGQRYVVALQLVSLQELRVFASSIPSPLKRNQHELRTTRNDRSGGADFWRDAGESAIPALEHHGRHQPPDGRRLAVAEHGLQRRHRARLQRADDPDRHSHRRGDESLPREG